MTILNVTSIALPCITDQLMFNVHSAYLNVYICPIWNVSLCFIKLVLISWKWKIDDVLFRSMYFLCEINGFESLNLWSSTCWKLIRPLNKQSNDRWNNAYSRCNVRISQHYHRPPIRTFECTNRCCTVRNTLLATRVRNIFSFWH